MIYLFRLFFSEFDLQMDDAHLLI